MSTLWLCACASVPQNDDNQNKKVHSTGQQNTAKVTKPASIDKPKAIECHYKNATRAQNLAAHDERAILSRKPPYYPTSAMEQGLQGYVKMGFDITADGIPVNIVVIESKPTRIFDTSATKTLARWRYERRDKSHKRATSLCQRIQFDFQLPDGWASDRPKIEID